MQDKNIKKYFLSTGDLFQMPYLDNSVDIVYTSHSIEPNGGRELEALKELYRVTRSYLIILEPSYELADKRGMERMKEYGYIANLLETAKKLDYKIIEYRLSDYSSNNLNPTGLMIIEKNNEFKNYINPLACPISRTKLELMGNCYYSKESLLAYPMINNIPCLLPENAVIASKLNDFL